MTREPHALNETHGKGEAGASARANSALPDGASSDAAGQGRATTPALQGFALSGEEHLPLYRRLFEGLRQRIVSGQLSAGTRLPSSRTLARELGVSRNTVALAFDQLLSEGYLRTVGGAGTYVADLTVPTPTPTPAADRAPGMTGAARTHELRAQVGSFWFPHVSTPAGHTPAFRLAVPASEAFPLATWKRCLSRHTARLSTDLFLSQEDGGLPALREVLASYLAVYRGVRCSPEQIIIADSHLSFHLAARVLLDPGDAVWFEDPGYFGARRALLAAGARLIPVPVDAQGIDVEAGRSLAPLARMAYVTPSYQFPSGVTMSAARRQALLHWAREAQAWILEDDFDCEFRYVGPPITALQGLDSANRVLYSGSFNKTLFPALRLGYLVVPPQQVDDFLWMRRVLSAPASLLEQAALADFIEEGHFARHMKRCRTLYAARRTALHRALEEELGDLVFLQPPQAGTYWVLPLPPGLSDLRVAQAAQTAGLEVWPLSTWSLGSAGTQGLLLGYAATNEVQLREGVQRLARVIRTEMAVT